MKHLFYILSAGLVIGCGHSNSDPATITASPAPAPAAYQLVAFTPTGQLTGGAAGSQTALVSFAECGALNPGDILHNQTFGAETGDSYSLISIYLLCMSQELQLYHLTQLLD